MAAGTAKRSAIAARMSGVRTVAKAICPIARVAPPARTPTTSAPMTPEPLWKAASPGCQAREERQRVDREREQQPAEEADAGNAQNKSDDEHGG